nr:aminotransferase class V-fold PLP-dependent enzyme [Pseudonocardia sp. C8]
MYPGADAAVYLDAAAVGIVSTRVADAMAHAVSRHQLRGIADAADRAAELVAARRAVAELVGGDADRVAFTQNTSTGLALVVNGICWAAGDNVVVPAGEFPSNLYPWVHLQPRGVELRRVPMRDGRAPTGDILAAIDARTRVVAVSAVQYSSGHRNDLAALGDACRQRDCLLVVDGTQAVGALVIDTDGSGIDVLAASAHKWMLGPLGIGFVHLSPRALRDLRPSTVGWLSVQEPFRFGSEPDLARDARRLESGTENVAGIAGLLAAVTLALEIGPARVEAHVLDRTAELAELLAERGWTARRDPRPETWSGILVATGGDAEAAHPRLLEAGVRCSLRGGGIRFAPHYYTGTPDLRATVAALA